MPHKVFFWHYILCWSVDLRTASWPCIDCYWLFPGQGHPPSFTFIFNENMNIYYSVWIPETLSNFSVYAIIRLSIYRIRCDFGMSICTAIGISPNYHFTNTSMSFIRKLLFSILIIPPTHVIFVCWNVWSWHDRLCCTFDPTNNDLLFLSTYELFSFGQPQPNPSSTQLSLSCG